MPASLDGGALMRDLVALHRSLLPPVDERPVHDALDDFHDAAAKADHARYFGRFAPEGIFLGTDASERWDVAAFKEYAGFAFERRSAWIYVPSGRSVEFSPDGGLAWFDETVVNTTYGRCRGSGVLRQIDGEWKIAQYNLTVPVPNDLLRGVARRIRAFEAGAAPAATTVILVRHAEKLGGDDPSLSDAGRARAAQLAAMLEFAGVDAVYASEWKRTFETAEPLTAALGVELKRVPARESKELAAHILAAHAGQTVVVVGHSNTLPEIMRALGVRAPVTIAEAEYRNLFAVSVEGESASLLRLGFPD